MGTPSLIIVRENDQFLLANYCQWDGNPGEIGVKILHFLRKDFKRKVFLERLHDAKHVTEEERLELFRSAGGIARCTNEFMPIEQRPYPTLQRDYGARILSHIQNAPVSPTNPLYLYLDIDPYLNAWEYLIDFDKGVYAVCASAFDERACWPLDALPTIYQFLATCEIAYPGLKPHHNYILSKLSKPPQ